MIKMQSYDLVYGIILLEEENITSL